MWRNDLSCQLISHAKLTHAYRRVLSSLDIRLPDRLIAYVGPSRVGKSRVTRLIVSEYAGDAPQSPLPTETCPIVRVELPNHTKNNRFSPKAFWHHALHEIKHPMSVSGKLNEKRAQLTEDQLADMFGRALQCMRTHWFLIDEAQHINWALTGQRGACRFLDGLKSFSEQYGVPIILSGAAPLAPTINSTPHVAGRMSWIFHERYYQDRDEDVSEYCRFISESLSRIPCSKDIYSEDTFAALVSASIGIPGLLFRILDASVTEANAREDNTLSVVHIRHGIKFCTISSEVKAEIEAADILAGRTVGSVNSESRAESINSKQSGSIKLKPFQSKPSRIVPESFS